MIHVYFSDFFGVDPDDLEDYGALDISVLTDLPLFIDPFLLFNSAEPEYQKLHEEMIKYLLFLCEESKKGKLDEGLVDRWFRFPEVRQTWLGFSKSGNAGKGLGPKFAQALNENFQAIFLDFGTEKVTKGTHLEKLCLVKEGVGKDTISDFTTNLILGFLCEYTQTFAKAHIDSALLDTFAVDHAAFNYETRSWISKRYTLPRHGKDYVLLCPKDILAKDDTWINKEDLWQVFPEIPEAISNQELRAQINDYFISKLPKESDQKKKGPTIREKHDAMRETLLKFPQLYDYYIRQKEDTGDQARALRDEQVLEVQTIFIRQARELVEKLEQATQFYATPTSTLEETRRRVRYFKNVIENNGGWRFFYHDGKPFRREDDAQILFRLTWFGTLHDVSREVNDGRGPVDFKISHGAKDKCLAELKLASNTSLRRNLQNQLEIYKTASEAEHGMKVILFFTQDEELKVRALLKELEMDKNENIVLIDARSDNKPSGSKA